MSSRGRSKERGRGQSRESGRGQSRESGRGHSRGVGQSIGRGRPRHNQRETNAPGKMNGEEEISSLDSRLIAEQVGSRQYNTSGGTSVHQDFELTVHHKPTSSISKSQVAGPTSSTSSATHRPTPSSSTPQVESSTSSSSKSQVAGPTLSTSSATHRPTPSSSTPQVESLTSSSSKSQVAGPTLSTSSAIHRPTPSSSTPQVESSTSSSSKSQVAGPTLSTSSATHRPTSSSHRPVSSSATPSSTSAPQSASVVPFVSQDPPKRPDEGGTKGSRISLSANHFALTIPAGFVYHYDVQIKPDKCPIRLNRQVIKKLEECYADKLQHCKLAFDGKANIYITKRLPAAIDSISFDVTIKPQGEDREKAFKVHIKYVATVSLDAVKDLTCYTSTNAEESQQGIQALDIIFRTLPSMRFAAVGRNFFTNAGAPIGQGREVWHGYYQSVRPDMWSIVLNVDVSSTAFYKEQAVLQFLAEVLDRGGGGYRGGGARGGRGGIRGGRGGARGGYGGGTRDDHREDGASAPEIHVPKFLDDAQRRKFAKEIKGLKVQLTYLPYPRKYAVKDVTRESASKLKFDCEGKQCTVQKYFKDYHKKELQYPDLPCLHMAAKSNSVYIPMELCLVIGQNCTRKLTSDQTSAMIRSTAIPATERKLQILDKMEAANIEGDEYLKHFGIKVSKHMMKVDGRVLDPPTLCYEKGTSVPRNGAWDMRERHFISGACVEKWGIIVFPNVRYFNEDSLRNFIEQLQEAGRQKGLTFKGNPYVCYFLPRDVLDKKFEEFREAKLRLVIAILDEKSCVSYNEVKRVGDNQVGICTQCILSKNAKKANFSTMGNLCLKINSKLGGLNSFIHAEHNVMSSIFKAPYIIMGADVTHPHSQDKKSPSIAAMTASMDRNAMDYRAFVKVLRHRQEALTTDQVAEMVKNHLIQFYRKTQRKPYHIIFYRDGVSQGQFKEVICQEIAGVQKACISLEKDYKPGITFLVVQKRHHTRFFCNNRQDEDGKGRNIPAGTTVDKAITHPTEFDFYLCSHAGIQGTSKPAHYHVLWDDNKFSSDNLQMLTYQLCHCYVRCNRSVSYPAPTYYSHLAAFRARYHLQDYEEKSGAGSDSASESGSIMSYTSDELKLFQEAVNVNKEMENSMYFV